MKKAKFVCTIRLCLLVMNTAFFTGCDGDSGNEPKTEANSDTIDFVGPVEEEHPPNRVDRERSDIEEPVSKEVLIHAPEQVRAGTHSLVLEPILAMDYMPVLPPGGPKLRCIVQVVAKGERAFPANLDTTYLWVVKGEETWAVPLPSEEVDVGRGNVLAKEMRGGPKWTGGGLTVVIRLVDSETRKSHLLRASNQGVIVTH